MAVRLNNQEAGGFKLLEEDAMDDRPCAAVKKFVTSVLDRKDMKDQDVASSFRNLMEYRDWTSSPSACSVATSSSALDGDRLNSPPSPPSPTAMQAVNMSGGSSSRDDQRLPNELLDEICEDIGMKEGMELDFVEFLMEQDTNPHAYMTQEAISSGAYNSAAGSTISTPTGSGSGMGSRTGSNSGSGSGSQHSNKDGSSNNNNNNNNNNKASANLNNHNNNETSKGLTLLGPSSSSNNNNSSSMTPNFLFKPNFSHDSDWLSQIPSPIINTSSGPSSGANTVVSSENNSPAQKRLHLSVSTDTSPNKGRSQTPPGFNQPKQHHHHHHLHQHQSNYHNSSLPSYGGSSSGISDSGFNQDYSSSSYNNASGPQSYFKMPQPAAGSSVMTKRSHSYPQGAPASSPVHSLGSQGSSASSTHSLSNNNNNSQSRIMSGNGSNSGMSKVDYMDKTTSCQASDSSDIEDAVSSSNNNHKNNVTSSKDNSNNNNNVNLDIIKKEPSVSPMNDVPSSPCDFVKPVSPSSKGTQQLGGRDTSVFQRVGGSNGMPTTQAPTSAGPPPNINVKNMQQMHQNRWAQSGHQQHPHHQMDSTTAPSHHPHHAHQHPHQPSHHPSFYNKTMYPGAPFQQVHGPPMPHPPSGPSGPSHLTTVRTPVDSPLDQGYFSNESAGNCSNGSAPSPAFTSSSLSSFSSISTMMPADQQQQQQQPHHHPHQQHSHPHHYSHHTDHQHQHHQQHHHHHHQQPQKSALISQHQDGSEPTVRQTGQKSVHFADVPESGSPPVHPPTPVDMKPPLTTVTTFNVAAGTAPPTNPTPPDCAYDNMECSNTNTQQQPKGTMPSGKILPRYNHHGMKSGIAPYTVPNSQGQAMGPSSSSSASVQGQGYDFANRPSCAMSSSANASTPANESCAVASGSDQKIHPHQHSYSGGKPAGMASGANATPGFYGMDGSSNPGLIRGAPEPMEYPNPNQNPTPTSQMMRGGDYPMSNPSAANASGQASSGGPFPMDPFSMQHPHTTMTDQMQQSSMQQQGHNDSMSMAQSEHQQPQQYSSCSQQPQQQQPSDYCAPHPHHHSHPHLPQSTMQISSNPHAHPHHQGNFQQMPIAMSTPLSNRSMGGGVPGPPGMGAASYNNPSAMCPPGYENSYNHPHAQHPHHHRPEAIYPQQGPPHSKGWAGGPPSAGPEELHVQIPPQSPMKPGAMPPQMQQGLPHMQPSPTPGCAAPMGVQPHLQQQQRGPHPDFGPCMGINCNACKMSGAGPMGPQAPGPAPHPHMGPCVGPNCHMCKMNPPHPHHLSSHQPPHPGAHHQVGAMCPSPNCPSCKASQQPRPPILSSQQKFLQHLIMDESNSAYRSHPLFPLLRDLVIAEANFDNPRFHYQQLLSTLPNDLQKLLQNFLQRNRPSGHYQSNQAVESVIMDGLRLAHTNLVDKIRQRHEMEKMKASSTASLRSMEEFCQKFDHSINGPMGRPGVPNGMGPMGMGHPMGGYGHDGSYIQPGMAGPLGFRPLKDGPDHLMGDGHMATSSPQAKTESKKHPSLPKEAVAMMMEWLRNHKDNPYPNDDEKAMLIKQTGLSINQINYWFTNARRRILPKWAQCKT